MTLQDYMKKWDLSAGRLRSVMLAVICLYALSMWSCGSKKEIIDNRNHTTDSVMDRTVITSKILTVPLTRADLRLNLRELKNLPPGAVYTEKNGQASVRAERKDSIIYITATCDSLQLIVESQYREISRLHTQLEQQKTEVVKPPGWWATFKTNAFYIAIGMLLMLVIILMKKIWQKRPMSRWRL